MKNLIPILNLICELAPTFCARNYAGKLIENIKNKNTNPSCGESFVRNWAKEEPRIMKTILDAMGMEHL